MKATFLVCLVLFITSPLAVQSKCFIDMNLTSPYTWKENPIQGNIPAQWHWGKVNGTNFLTQLKNQHIPQYCGSCWAQATTSALSDRIAIIRGGKFPEINISPQLLLSCDLNLDGCQGGDSLGAYQWMHDNDITDETCAPYQAKSWKEGLQCNATSLCMECFPSGPCFQPKVFNRYRVAEYGRLPTLNQTAMMNEIFARGPIACSIFAESIVNFTGDGVYRGNDTDDHDHVVSVVGWGVTDDNVPYWHVRNSWGEYWGDQGYIKIYRGNDTLQIESNCVYGVPVNTWSNQTYPHQIPVSQKEGKQVNLLNKVEKLHEKAGLLYKYWAKQLKRHGCGIDYNKILMPVITQPLPEHTVDINSLPDDFFWGDVDGVNYLSWTVNQHLPHYCGSCWAQAGVASITDRIRILMNNRFPKVALSVQVLLNCVAEGSCRGGWGAGPFVFAHRHGIPEYGCQAYTASDPPISEICTPIQKCKSCKSDSKTNCWAVDNYKSWFISDHGSIRGADSIKKEVFARGPISCGMFATDKFEKSYTSGIYKERTLSPEPNHYVSIVGWGKDLKTKEEYYIGRNSWGSHFGENGFFRISMRGGSLGIGEYDCFWGVPVGNDIVDQLTSA